MVRYTVLLVTSTHSLGKRGLPYENFVSDLRNSTSSNAREFSTYPAKVHCTAVFACEMANFQGLRAKQANLPIMIKMT